MDKIKVLMIDDNIKLVEMIKEYSPAKERSTLQKSAPAIVEPERLIPGKVPIPCILFLIHVPIL